jgi:hypothetical protein
VSVLIRLREMVCKNMNEDSDGTSKHEEWYECGRQSWI